VNFRSCRTSPRPPSCPAVAAGEPAGALPSSRAGSDQPVDQVKPSPAWPDGWTPGPSVSLCGSLLPGVKSLPDYSIPEN
jgi:hypothetical protein